MHEFCVYAFPVCFFCVLNVDIFVFCLVICRQKKRVSILLMAALLEGASIGPLIGIAVEIDPR